MPNKRLSYGFACYLEKTLSFITKVSNMFKVIDLMLFGAGIFGGDLMNLF